MIRTYVLDANAVLDFSEYGPGWKRIEQIFEDVLAERAQALVSVINWGEIFYLFWQRRGEEFAKRDLASLSHLPLQLVPVDLLQSLKAGEIRALHKIPYVDFVAAALAELHHGILVTSDSDFKKLGRRIQVLWLART